MKGRDLNREWAESQLEAWADGSLTGANRERLQALLASDVRLKSAAERAAAVRRALRGSAPPIPRGLRRRLLAISGGAFGSWPLLAVPATAFAIAIVDVTLLLQPAAPPPAPDPRMAAVQEFELAMRYLQKSARVTESEVTTTVGTGLRNALVTSHQSLERTTKEKGG